MCRWLLVICALAVVACGTSSDEPTARVAPPQQCPTDVVEGVDVFAGTGAIDWTMVYGDNRRFAFIKATQGDYNRQSTFNANWTNAHAAGVLRSPYHFFDGTVDGVAQANYFLAEVNAAGGLQAGDLPPLLDIECPTSSNQNTTQSNCEGTAGNSGWVPTATLKQRVYDWLDTVQAATGTTPYIYSYGSWFASVGFTDAKLATYPLFIASYNACANVPAPWTQAVFWQYGATGTVHGINGQCDVDRFFGTYDQLVAQTIQPAGADAGTGISDDAGTGPPPAGAGCGCRTGGPPIGAACAFIALLVVRRRSRRR